MPFAYIWSGLPKACACVLVSSSSVPRAVIATKLSSSMPPYPMIFASGSLATCLDVVPDETSAWKPEHAPHATVVKSSGNNGSPPGFTHPVNAG